MDNDSYFFNFNFQTLKILKNFYDVSVLSKPKNSSGKDNISTKLLKEIIESIVYPIAHLFNLSFFKQDISLVIINVQK